MKKKTNLMDTTNQPQFDQRLAVRIVGCSYDGSRKQYSFFTANPRVQKGDLVIVRDKNGFRLVTAQDTVDPDSAQAAYANNWIVGRVEEVMEDFVKQLGKLDKAKKDRHRLFMRTIGRAIRDRQEADHESTGRHFKELMLGDDYGLSFVPFPSSRPFFNFMNGRTPTGRIHDEVLFPFQSEHIMDAMRKAGALEFGPGSVLHDIDFADLEKRVMAAAASSPSVNLIFSDHIDLVGEEGKVVGYPRSMFTGKLRQILTDRLNNLTNATLTKEDLSDDERPAEGFTIYGEE